MHRVEILIKTSILLCFCAGIMIKDVCSVLQNIALNKNTKQSTTHEAYGTGFAILLESSLANDGNRQQHSGGFNPNQPTDALIICSHTSMPPQSNEWWAVNLGAIFNISRITVYGRDDCCIDLYDFDVDIIAPTTESGFLTFDTMDNGHITYNQYLSNSIRRWEMNFFDRRGQFVRIRHRGRRILTLCEVEVYSELSCFSAPGVSQAPGVSRYRVVPGHRYQGTTIEVTPASTTVECVMLCKAEPCCYAGNFRIDTRQCTLTKEIVPAITDAFLSAAEYDAFSLF